MIFEESNDCRKLSKSWLAQLLSSLLRQIYEFTLFQESQRFPSLALKSRGPNVDLPHAQGSCFGNHAPRHLAPATRVARDGSWGKLCPSGAFACVSDAAERREEQVHG